MKSSKIKDIPLDSKFGQWTVLAYVGEKGKGKNSYWLCECSCGNHREVNGSLLRCGKSSKCNSCSNKENGRVGLYRTKRQHLYIIRVGDYYKIGVSDNPQRRVKDIKSNCPYDVILEGVLENEGYNEKAWHDANGKNHHRGEWFKGVVIRANGCDLP